MHHRDNLSEDEKNFLNSLESDYKFKNNKNNISLTIFHDDNDVFIKHKLTFILLIHKWIETSIDEQIIGKYINLIYNDNSYDINYFGYTFIENNKNNFDVICNNGLKFKLESIRE